MGDGHVPESSEVRNQRILQWLSDESVTARLSAGAENNYRESGRGFWVARFRQEGLGADCEWVCGNDYQELVRRGKIAPDPVRENVLNMLTTYDPPRQFVLVAQYPGNAPDVYTVRYAPGAPPSLDG